MARRAAQAAAAAWETVVGLEVHAQIATGSKLFSAAQTAFGAPPNAQVALFDAAFPGTLPRVNRRCVDLALRTGLALDGRVNQVSFFDRKHYFYFDLPHGFQITQQRRPIIEGGRLGEVRVTRIHIEQDSGKSIHDQHPTLSLVDLNRAGVPLMEIVTEPDMRTSDDAAQFLRDLQALLRWIGTCDGNMDQGSMRCDVNVSVRRRDAGPDALGVRTELKNLTSIKQVAKAIDAEAARQIAVLESGGVVERETRRFDAVRGETFLMRRKEDETDYRFFPEPDLPPLVIDDERLEAVRAQIPELPRALQRRLVDQYGITPYDAAVLVESPATARYFEEACAVAEGPPAPAVAALLTTEVFGRQHAHGRSGLDSCPLSAAQLGELAALHRSGVISSKISKAVLDLVFAGDCEPGAPVRAIIDERGWALITDPAELERLCREALAAHPSEAQRLPTEPRKMRKFFIGKVMALSGGRAHPKLLQQTINSL